MIQCVNGCALPDVLAGEAGINQGAEKHGIDKRCHSSRKGQGKTITTHAKN
jgi:hypothetical protein